MPPSIERKGSFVTRAGRATRKLNACIATCVHAFTNPIVLTHARAARLDELRQNVMMNDLHTVDLLHIKAVNLSPALDACLLASGLRSRIKWSVTCTDKAAEDPCSILAACAVAADCNLVLIELAESSEGLSYAEQSIAAFAMLSCVPVMFLAAEQCKALEEAASSPAGSIWGTCQSYYELEQRLRGDLCRSVALRQELLHEVQGLLQPYREVNKVMHFAKRGSLALVPFGVHTVNALGLVRLARRVLNVTGMASSKHARKVVATQTAASGVKVTMIDTVSDLYQLIVQGSIVSEAVSAAAGAASIAAGAAAAADTITLLDAFTLGSVCVVTGMVSAWGAAVCRPSTVDGMARVIAAQQLVAVMKPSLQARVDSVNTVNPEDEVEFDRADDHSQGVGQAGGSSSSNGRGSSSTGQSSRKVWLTSHEL